MLKLTAEEKQDLELWAQSRTLPAGDVFRARLSLATIQNELGTVWISRDTAAHMSSQPPWIVVEDGLGATISLRCDFLPEFHMASTIHD